MSRIPCKAIFSVNPVWLLLSDVSTVALSSDPLKWNVNCDGFEPSFAATVGEFSSFFPASGQKCTA